MRFEEAYGGWNEGRLTQAEAAMLLGVLACTLAASRAQAPAQGMATHLKIYVLQFSKAYDADASL